MKKLILVLAIVFLMVSGPAFAAELVFNWDACIEDDIAGYRIYGGSATGAYTEIKDAGNAVTYTWLDVPDGEWFFAATCYDTAGNESTYSNEVSVVIDSLPPGPPNNLSATITATQVTIKTVE